MVHIHYRVSDALAAVGYFIPEFLQAYPVYSYCKRPRCVLTFGNIQSCLLLPAQTPLCGSRFELSKE